MTLRGPIWTRLSLAWLIFVPIATLAQVVFYIDPYRWLNEWVLEHHGDSDTVLTAVIPALLLMAPGLAVLIRAQAGIPAPVVKPMSKAAAERVVIRVTLTFGLAVAVAAAVVFGLGQRVPDGSTPPATIDIAALGAGEPPAATAILIGDVDIKHVVSKAGGSKASPPSRTWYFPVAGRGQVGRPIRFVVDFHDANSAEHDFAASFAPDLASETLKGVLIRDGVPRDMAWALRRKGVNLADRVYLLTTSRGGAREDYDIGAALLAVVAAIMLGLAGATTVSGYLRARAEAR